MKERKVIIIKTGHSEVFNEAQSSTVCSLGDVLRSSFLLNYYTNDEVLWVTADKAFPLIQKQVQTINLNKFYKLDLSKYDVIINLEKDEKLISYLDKKENVFGFFMKNAKYIFRTYPQKENYSLTQITELIFHNKNQKFQYHLSNLLGETWNNETYVFQKSNKNNITSKIGFNWFAGSKWPKKTLDKSIWKKLESTLEKDYEISWQEGFNDLQTYINWIDSCDKIISLDSLGLHISLALNKQVTALFGPTKASEVEMYDRGEKLFYSQQLQNDSKKLDIFIDDIVKSLKK